MAEEKEATPVKKSGMKPILAIGIGCFVLLILIGTGISYAIKYFAEKAGVSMLQGAIESKTGVKTNIEDLEKGKMTFTDTETGQTVSVGSQQLPVDFPKDFPVYPGAAVAGSVSGMKQGEGSGHLVTFTTKDSLEKVIKYYTDELTKQGWKTTASFNTEKMQTWAVSKGTQEGSLSVSSEEDTTTILATLGNKN